MFVHVHASPLRLSSSKHRRCLRVVGTIVFKARFVWGFQHPWSIKVSGVVACIQIDTCFHQLSNGIRTHSWAMPPRPWRTALEIEVLCSLNKSHLFSLVSLWFLDAAHFLFAFTFEVHIFQHFPPIQMFPCLQVKMLQNPHSYRHFSYVIWILKHHCTTVLSFILNKNHCY